MNPTTLGIESRLLDERVPCLDRDFSSRLELSNDELVRKAVAQVEHAFAARIESHTPIHPECPYIAQIGVGERRHRGAGTRAHIDELEARAVA